jgi:16S rRNA G527 N7-methylase RsmG
VVVQRFDEAVISRANFVTCRALEQLVEQTPAILNWAPQGSSLLLFGGESLGQALSAAGAKFEKVLMPLSDRRFLFSVTRA